MIDVRGGREESREFLDISGWPAHGRATRVAQLGVDQLVCGALSSFDEAGFQESPVRLVSRVGVRWTPSLRRSSPGRSCPGRSIGVSAVMCIPRGRGDGSGHRSVNGERRDMEQAIKVELLSRAGKDKHGTEDVGFLRI